ncbi:MAG: molybdopterin cofactor-binding domain-containing protein [Chloroflexota bacterium]
MAAADRETLRAAKRAVRLRTQPLPAVFDPLESDHEFACYEVGRGDVDAAMAAPDVVVVEGTYRVGHQEQLYIENQGMIAVPRDDGGVTVHGSLRYPYVHPALKRALALTDQQAVVVQTETGGGFGGGRIAVDHWRSTRRSGAGLRPPGAHDTRPSRGPGRDDQAPPRDRAVPDRRPS